MKPGEGPGRYLADVYDPKVTRDQLIERMKRCEYGTGEYKMRPDLAEMYWRDARRG